MPDDKFPVAVVGGVPVLAAPEDIDITNAEALRSALLKEASNGHGTLVVDMTRGRGPGANGPPRRSTRTRPGTGDTPRADDGNGRRSARTMRRT